MMGKAGGWRPQQARRIHVSKMQSPFQSLDKVFFLCYTDYANVGLQSRPQF